MNNNHKTIRPYTQSSTSVINLANDQIRHFGNIRSVMIRKNNVNTDRLFGFGKTTQAVVDSVFGKTVVAQLNGVVQ